MFRRRRRGLGFFPGLVFGAILGVGASAAFDTELHDGALRLQQEASSWRAKAVETTSQALTQAEDFVTQTESSLHEQLSNLTEVISRDANASAEN